MGEKCQRNRRRLESEYPLAQRHKRAQHVTRRVDHQGPEELRLDIRRLPVRSPCRCPSPPHFQHRRHQPRQRQNVRRDCVFIGPHGKPHLPVGVFGFDNAIFRSKWTAVDAAHSRRNAIGVFNGYVKHHISDHRPLWTELRTHGQWVLLNHTERPTWFTGERDGRLCPHLFPRSRRAEPVRLRCRCSPTTRRPQV